MREITLHKYEPQRFNFPLAAAREQALEKFETLDIPSHIEKLAPADQLERAGVLKSSSDADPSVIQARLKASEARSSQIALEQHKIDPNHEDRNKSSPSQETLIEQPPEGDPLQEAFIERPPAGDRQFGPIHEGENEINIPVAVSGEAKKQKQINKAPLGSESASSSIVPILLSAEPISNKPQLPDPPLVPISIQRYNEYGPSPGCHSCIM